VSARCPSCGARPEVGEDCECRNHFPPYHDLRSFNARCARCWAEVWNAIARSLFLSARRALRWRRP